MVTVFALAGKVSPAGRMGTVMSLMASGNIVGTALGQALAGTLSDAFGHRGAYAAATGAAVVLVLTGILAAVLEARSRDRLATTAAAGEERAWVPEGTASGTSSKP
jgi:predicted MFS family arabinose efflux permease